MRKLASILALLVTVLTVAPGMAKASGKTQKSRPTIRVSIDHDSGNAMQVRVRNTSGVDLQKVTLSLSVVKSNGVAVESAVEITDLAANDAIPAKIKLPSDDASVTRVEIVRAVARTTESRRVVPEVDLVVLAH